MEKPLSKGKIKTGKLQEWMQQIKVGDTGIFPQARRRCYRSMEPEWDI